jgi:hypothetical protein
MKPHETPVPPRRSYEAYVEYNRTLRAWYVGFGVATPLAIAAQDKLYDELVGSGLGFYVTLFFVVGVMAQILNTVANKWMNWYRYETNSGRTARPAFMKNWSDWYRNAYILHLLADFITGFCYLISISLLLLVLFSNRQ